MTHRKHALLLTAVILLSLFLPALATAGLTDVHLLQSFVYDAPIASSPYAEFGMVYVDFDFVSELIFGARGGFPVNSKLEIVAQLAYVNISPEFGDAMNGLSDVGLFGRYNLVDNRQTQVSVGPLLTIPIGAEEVGQSNLNFGGFAAIRHTAGDQLVITGNGGLEFVETWDGREASLFLGAGAIYQLKETMALMAEWTYRDWFDYMFLSCGLDLILGPGRLRFGAGIGLDDGAPDFMAAGGYLMPF